MSPGLNEKYEEQNSAPHHSKKASASLDYACEVANIVVIKEEEEGWTVSGKSEWKFQIFLPGYLFLHVVLTSFFVSHKTQVIVQMEEKLAHVGKRERNHARREKRL